MDDLGAWENGRMHHWRQAALELSDGRTDEFARTALVIALYFLQVASAFTREVGGDPPTPPVRFAISLFLCGCDCVSVSLTRSIGRRDIVRPFPLLPSPRSFPLQLHWGVYFQAGLPEHPLSSRGSHSSRKHRGAR